MVCALQWVEVSIRPSPGGRLPQRGRVQPEEAPLPGPQHPARIALPSTTILRDENSRERSRPQGVRRTHRVRPGRSAPGRRRCLAATTHPLSAQGRAAIGGTPRTAPPPLRQLSAGPCRRRTPTHSARPADSRTVGVRDSSRIAAGVRRHPGPGRLRCVGNRQVGDRTSHHASAAPGSFAPRIQRATALPRDPAPLTRRPRPARRAGARERAQTLHAERETVGRAARGRPVRPWKASHLTSRQRMSASFSSSS